LRDRGIDVADTLRAHVVPQGCEHISLTGDYLWSEIDKPRERFRPLRTTGSVGYPAEKLDQINVMKGYDVPRAGLTQCLRSIAERAGVSIERVRSAQTLKVSFGVVPHF
jgi:hypothetical protein